MSGLHYCAPPLFHLPEESSFIFSIAAYFVVAVSQMAITFEATCCDWNSKQHIESRSGLANDPTWPSPFSQLSSRVSNASGVLIRGTERIGSKPEGHRSC